MGLFSRFRRGAGSDESGAAAPDSAASTGADATPEAGLKKFSRLHKWDPFVDADRLDSVDDVVATGDPEKEAAVEESLVDEDSPYPEVRASVLPTDDPTQPVNTIRAWTIGAVMCTIVAACNIMLGLRKSPITIPATVVQLVSYPYVNCVFSPPEALSRPRGREDDR